MTARFSLPAVIHIEADDDVTREQVAPELNGALGGVTVLTGTSIWSRANRASETTGSAIVDSIETTTLDPSPPPAMWMEAVARTAITAAFRELPARLPRIGVAMLAEAFGPEDIERAVREALGTPPPADDGGPSDPITAVGKAATEEARRLPAIPPEAVATTLVQTLRHAPWEEPDAAEAWQLLGAMCILAAAQAVMRDG